MTWLFPNPALAQRIGKPAQAVPLTLQLKDLLMTQGVCDFSKAGVGQAPLKGTWLKY